MTFVEAERLCRLEDLDRKTCDPAASTASARFRRNRCDVLVLSIESAGHGRHSIERVLDVDVARPARPEARRSRGAPCPRRRRAPSRHSGSSRRRALPNRGGPLPFRCLPAARLRGDPPPRREPASEMRSAARIMIRRSSRARRGFARRAARRRSPESRR